MVEKTIFCPNKCNDIYLLRHTVKNDYEEGDDLFLKKENGRLITFVKSVDGD